MGAVQNIIGIVRDINERKENKRIEDVLRQNYLTDPRAAIPELVQIDPFKAQAYQAQLDEQDAQKTARQQAALKARQERLGGATRFLRGYEGADMGGAIDNLAPLYRDVLGMEDGEIEAMRRMATAEGFNPLALDDDAFKAMVKDRYSDTVLTPGSVALREGEVRYRNPVALKTVTTRGGDGSARTDTFDPNPGGGFVDAGGAPTMPGVPAPIAGGGTGLAGPALGALIEETALGAVPGLRVSGRGRTAQRNKEVGGVTGSYHLTDEARDFSPGQGQTQDQLYQELRRAFPTGFDVVKGKKGHVHVEPSTRPSRGGPPAAPQAARSTVAMPGRPAPAARAGATARTLSPQEAEQLGFPAGSVVQEDSNGKLRVVQKPSAAAAKTAQGAPAQTRIRETMTSRLSSLAEVYTELGRMGAIVDPARSTSANIGARIRSSGVGQFIGGAVGAEEQSLREQINNMRPLLVQDIRKASEMGAKGMDSNVELQFYLQAATDPQKDIISNMAAIHILDTALGNGDALKKSLPADMYKRVTDRAGVMSKNRPLRVDLGGAAQTRNPVPVGTRARNPQTGEVMEMTRSGWKKVN